METSRAFLLYRKLFVSYKAKKMLRKDAHLAEKKLAVNSTARARKSRKRLFVQRKNYQFCQNVVNYANHLERVGRILYG